MFSVSIYTLGCKLNQLESEAIADTFKCNGFSLTAWEEGQNGISPDIIIISTCTVTSRSDQKARRIIRKALRDNPRSVVIATGCYAVLDKEKLEKLEDCIPAEDRLPAEHRLFVIDNKTDMLNLPADLGRQFKDTPPNKAELRETIARCLITRNQAHLTKTQAHPAKTDNGEFFSYTPRTFSFHTRAFLKIQDGCDNNCTYCRIRLARGPGRSMDAGKILAELRALEAAGYWEAVLTGVNISQYGAGNPVIPESSGELGGLLNFLLEGTQNIGIRLSSLEPLKIDETLAGVLAHPRIRPHFHLSVQSGSSTVLQKMGRSYSALDVEKAVVLLRSVKNKPFIACDIIAGFPGESEEQFEETLALCRNVGFAWIHAFPYSKRPGTASFDYPQTISETETMRRVGILGRMALEGRRDYAQLWTGTELEAIVENSGKKKAGYNRGLTDNYLRVSIREDKNKPAVPGTVIKCRISGLASETECDVQAADYDIIKK